METTENNKLIAEFMGIYSEKNGYDYSRIGNKGVHYYTSWNWLMPVVESIFERMDARDESADDIKKHLLLCNIEGVYKAVVEFINWYNGSYYKDLDYLQDAMDKINFDMLDSLSYGDEIILNEKYTLYHYTEDDIIVIVQEEEWTEVLQVLYSREKNEITNETISTINFESLIKPNN